MRPRSTLETPVAIRRSAMDLLARREHSYAELQRKLRQRGAPSDLAEIELDRLVEDGLLSDERFCEAYIYARSQRGYGPARLREELRQRGVSESLVERSLAEADQDWQALASRLGHHDEIEAVAPFVELEGMLSHRGNVAGAMINGIEPQVL